MSIDGWATRHGAGDRNYIALFRPDGTLAAVTSMGAPNFLSVRVAGKWFAALAVNEERGEG